MIDRALEISAEQCCQVVSNNIYKKIIYEMTLDFSINKCGNVAFVFFVCQNNPKFYMTED